LQQTINAQAAELQNAREQRQAAQYAAEQNIEAMERRLAEELKKRDELFRVERAAETARMEQMIEEKMRMMQLEREGDRTAMQEKFDHEMARVQVSCKRNVFGWA
jgi:hypothetical protein